MTYRQTLNAIPGQNYSLQFTQLVYGVVVQNSTPYWWYIEEAPVYIPPYAIHFMASLIGIRSATVLFKSPSELPQAFTITGINNEAIFLFTDEKLPNSPGYTGSRRDILSYVLPILNIGVNTLQLQVPAPDGLNLTLQTNPLSDGYWIVTITFPDGTSEVRWIGYVHHGSFRKHITIPGSYPVGTIIQIQDHFNNNLGNSTINI